MKKVMLVFISLAPSAQKIRARPVKFKNYLTGANPACPVKSFVPYLTRGQNLPSAPSRLCVT
jgi:hypothetical protein